MGIDSRAKGASGEREFAALIHDDLGIQLVRNLDQTRSGGYDLIPSASAKGPAAETLHSLAIEVKRRATITPGILATFWQQAINQADEAGKLPVLAYRADRRPWSVVIPLKAINQELHNSTAFEYTATLTVPGFCAGVRE